MVQCVFMLDQSRGGIDLILLFEDKPNISLIIARRTGSVVTLGLLSSGGVTALTRVANTAQ